LLVPAIAFMGGIWLSQTLGPVLKPGWLAGCAACLMAALLATTRKPGRPRPGTVTTAILAGLALIAGLGRHQLTLHHPPNHVSTGLAAEPVLTRVAGRIVNSPLERRPTRLNPFIPFDPAPRTQFALALDELRTVEPPTAAAGHLRVTIKAAGLSLRLGQRVEVTGHLHPLQGPSNPGQPDWRAWHRQQGLDASLIVPGAEHLTVLADPPTLWHRLVAALRTRAHSLLFEPYADLETEPSTRLLDVMILGQRSVADEELNEAFLRAGGLHFLAVSGFNVAVLAGTTWLLFRKTLRRSRRTTALVTFCATLLFALVTEPNAPILRAVVSVVLACLAQLTHRPFCPLNWLALAAICILAYNPNQLFGAAFQLSFVQVLSLITLVPAAYRWILRRLVGRGAWTGPAAPEARTLAQLLRRQVGRAALGLAVTCTCAYLISQPLVLVHFGRFAPWGWLSTMLLSPVVAFLTLVSIGAVTANALLPPVGALLTPIAHRTATFLLWSVGLFEHFPAAVIECSPPPAWLVIGTYGGLLALLTSRVGPRCSTTTAPGYPGRLISARTLVAAGLATLLALAWVGWAILPPGLGHADCVLCVLAVGNGSAALLTTPGGQTAVFDVGTDTNSDAGQTAAAALRRLGARGVDLAVVSHLNFDHYSGLPTLMRRLPVQRWLTGGYTEKPAARRALANLLRQLPPQADRPEVLAAPAHLSAGPVELEVIWPPPDLPGKWTVNDRSLVIRLTVHGRTVLLPGDIQRDAMRALLEAERDGRLSLKADVLIAPHHGSVFGKLTADFYAAVSPRLVVASSLAGRPKLKRLVQDTLGPVSRVLVTGEVGAVTVRVTPAGQLVVQTPHSRDGRPSHRPVALP